MIPPGQWLPRLIPLVSAPSAPDTQSIEQPPLDVQSDTTTASHRAATTITGYPITPAQTPSLPDSELIEQTSLDVPSGTVAASRSAASTSADTHNTPSPATSGLKSKPVNGFFMYKASLLRTEPREKGIDGKELSTRQSLRWHSLSNEEKEEWKEKSRVYRAEYNLEHKGLKPERRKRQNKKSNAKARRTRGTEANEGIPSARRFTPYDRPEEPHEDVGSTTTELHSATTSPSFISVPGQVQDGWNGESRTMTPWSDAPGRSLGMGVAPLPLPLDYTIPYNNGLDSGTTYTGTTTMRNLFAPPMVGPQAGLMPVPTAGRNNQWPGQHPADFYYGPYHRQTAPARLRQSNFQDTFADPSTTQWGQGLTQSNFNSMGFGGMPQYGTQMGEISGNFDYPGANDISDFASQQYYGEESWLSSLTERGQNDFNQVDPIRSGAGSSQTTNGLDHSNINVPFDPNTDCALLDYTAPMANTFFPPFDSTATTTENAKRNDHAEEFDMGAFNLDPPSSEDQPPRFY